MDFTLRNCTLNDLDFILNLKELGMKWYIEKLYGWNAEIQKAKTLEELNKYLNDMKIIMIIKKKYLDMVLYMLILALVILYEFLK